MGYIKNHSIIVTSHFKDCINKAHEAAISIFKELNIDYHGKNEELVTEIFEGKVNTQYTFFIVPDGSKEGWGFSERCDKAREDFCAWMESNQCSCDYVEVTFGGDDEYCEITKKS